MKESIKKRIEAVRRGEVPEGYRIENGYLIPNDWKTVPLNRRFTRSTRKNKSGCENVLTISAQMGLVNQREFYDKDIASEDNSSYFLMKNGEFAYNKSYSTGYPYGAIKQLAKYDEGIVSPLYICFAPKAGTNTAFYTQYFEGGRYNREIYRIAQEGARNHGLLNIAVDDFFTGTLTEPGADEQQRIAEILATCDRVIELTQGKIDELNKLKQTCLRKMFPQKGQTVPEARFPGFSDPWEQRKVSELFRVTRGYVLAATLTEPTKTDEKPYPVYSSQTKDKGLMGYYKDYLYEDAITWTTDGANAGTVNYRAGKFYCTNVCGVLLSNEVTANQMIAEALNNVAKGYVSYVGNPKLMNNVMADIEILIPAQAEEREQLSVFFANLDHLITLHQRELEEYGKYKKALMQLLLTGLVRVNA